MKSYLQLHSRRDSYLPLIANYASHSHNRRSLYHTIIIIVSVALNVCFLYHYFNHPKLPPPLRNPLNHYQSLNPFPLVTDDVLSTSLAPQFFNPDEHAVVTTLYTDAFAPAVATLGHSLRKADVSARLILLYLPEKVSPSALCVATSSGFIPQPVSRIPPPKNGDGAHPHFLDQFTKLTLWKLDQQGIKSLVYLDADTLVRRNFDELFALPFNFAAVPDVYTDHNGYILGFNAGVLFIRTSTTVFNQMVSKIEHADFPLLEAEQSYLNHYFGAEVVRLPYAYNGNLAIKRRSPEMWKNTTEERRIVHFTWPKPFLQGDYERVPWYNLEEKVMEVSTWEDGLWKEEMLWWGDMFKEMKHIYRSTLKQCFRQPKSKQVASATSPTTS
ncbi:hypothetical protein QCA50_005207 [Cerrena zonata]|uniref:Glycosyltransferase family 8 protein n=1 Tax=Cerrena zonata TaxID=2478898 RepID=A0AAW0GKY5_9APHY